MKNLTILIIIDGLRADAVSESDRVKAFADFQYFQGQTVMPSLTLPCHASLFYGTSPNIHEITTNECESMPKGQSIFQSVCQKSTAFYSWQPLARLLNGVNQSYFIDSEQQDVFEVDKQITQLACQYLANTDNELIFFYLTAVDAMGHQHGWMSEQYIKAYEYHKTLLQKLFTVLPSQANIFITSDHGGHSKGHGTNCPDDMTIPLFIKSSREHPITNGFCITEIFDCLEQCSNYLPR